MMQPELSAPANDKYRPDIDGLQALAVLSVVLYLAFPQVFRGGYVGVNIVFVISGYLIFLILLAALSWLWPCVWRRSWPWPLCLRGQLRRCQV